MSLGWPDQAEPVDHFVGNEICVVAANLAMVLVVIMAAILHKRSQRWRQVFGLVLPDQIHYMIRDQSGEPAHSLASHAQVIRNPYRRGRHHLDAAGIAACNTCAFFHEAHTPGNQSRIGELQNDSVRHSTCHVQNLGTVAGNPNSRRIFRPAEAGGLAIVQHFLARGKIAELRHCGFQLRPTDGLLTHYAPRAVATADAKLHPSTRNQIQSCKQTGSYGQVTSRRIRNACAQMHALRVGRHQRQQGKRFLPQNMRIKNPAVFKSGVLRLPRQAYDAFDRDVRFQCDSELHGRSLSRKNYSGTDCEILVSKRATSTSN